MVWPVLKTGWLSVVGYLSVTLPFVIYACAFLLLLLLCDLPFVCLPAHMEEEPRQPRNRTAVVQLYQYDMMYCLPGVG